MGYHLGDLALPIGVPGVCPEHQQDYDTAEPAERDKQEGSVVEYWALHLLSPSQVLTYRLISYFIHIYRL